MTTDRDNERVSATYRDIATESTPPALDRRVLEAARREVRPRYSHVRAWMRPMAWAATIGLSLAILLEFTWFADTTPLPEPSPAARSVLETPVVPETPAEPEPEPAPSVSEEKARVDGTDESRARRDANVMKSKREDDLRQAAPQRMEAADVGVSAAATMLERSSVERQYCDDDARETAASWYACIGALRDEQRDEEAAFELEALLLAYPDFEVPAGE